MNGVKHGHGELLGGALKKKSKTEKQEYLQRRFFRTKANKYRPPKNTYSAIHNRLSFRNLPLLTKCGTALKSLLQIFIHWLNTDRPVHFDGQRTWLSCSSSASRDWQPDTKWRVVRLSLYPVIRSLPGICELPLQLLAACYYKNPSTPFFCTMSSSNHHPPTATLFSIYFYLFTFLFIYFHDFLISELPHIASIKKKKRTCTFIIFQFRASRFTLQDPLIPQWGDRYLHFD